MNNPCIRLPCTYCKNACNNVLRTSLSTLSWQEENFVDWFLSRRQQFTEYITNHLTLQICKNKGMNQISWFWLICIGFEFAKNLHGETEMVPSNFDQIFSCDWMPILTFGFCWVQHGQSSYWTAKSSFLFLTSDKHRSENLGPKLQPGGLKRYFFKFYKDWVSLLALLGLKALTHAG